MVKFLASRAARLLLVGAVVLAGSRSGAPGTGSENVRGSIAGTVTLGPQLAIRRVRFDLYPDPSRQPAPTRVPSITDELQNVVVYLESVPEGTDPGRSDDGPQEVRQEKLTFLPHVLPVVKGTTVEFPNQDTVFHNVFSLSKVASFDLGRYPTGASKSVRFTSPGAVKVFCHIHSDMSAIVLVLDNPFFASPGTDGRFAIEGIPPGQYRVVAWHERARLSSRTIRIAPGGTTQVDFEIPLSEIADDG